MLPGPTAAVRLPRAGQFLGYVAGAASYGTERVRRSGLTAATVAFTFIGLLITINLMANRRQPVVGLVLVLLATIAAARLIPIIHRGRRTGPAGLIQKGVERHVFVLRPVSGGQVTCILYGGLEPDVAVRHGNVARVTGHQRGGRFVVRRLELLATPAGPLIRTVRARWCAILATDPRLDRVGWAIAAVAVVSGLVVLTTNVR